MNKILVKIMSDGDYIIYLTVNEKLIACELAIGNIEKNLRVHEYLLTYFPHIKTAEEAKYVIEEITI
jgi:hypothetical protein